MSALDEADPSDPNTDPDGSSQSQRLVTVLKHFFRQMAAEEDLDTEQMEKCRIRDFVGWCNDHKSDWVTNYELAAGLKVHMTDLAVLESMLSDPYDAVAICMPLWRMLTLSGRKPLMHVPDFMHIAVTFGFNKDTTDERAVQISTPTRFDATKKMTDGFIASLIKDQFEAAVRTVAGMGLDKMYEEYSQVVAGERGKIIRKAVSPEDKARGSSDGL